MHQDILTYSSGGKEWTLPLNLAVAFHILLGLSVIYLPQFFERPPLFEDIYTVDLINIAETLPQEAPPSPEPIAEQPATPPSKPQVSPVVPEPVNKVIEDAITLHEPEIPDPIVMPEPAPAPDPVSIAPAKRKVKKVVPPEPRQPAKPKTTAQDISKLQREKLAEMIRAEEKAAEEARILAEEAELERRLAEAAAKRAKAARARAALSSGGETGTSRENSSRLSALELQYYSTVRAKIQPFWTLPRSREWPASLTALIVITIEKDGRIAGNFLEATSGDPMFDRFALKVLDDVGQLPPIPVAIKKNRIELGLKFTPGNIR